MKKKKVLFSVLCLIFLMGSVLVACSGQSSSSGGGDSNASNESSDSGNGGSQEVKQIKIATASTSGAFYPIGGVMASILSENMEGYNFTAEATGGSEENARLLDSDQADIGIFGGDSIYNAYNAKGPFEGNKIELRSIGRIYVNPFHIVVLDKSDIHSIEDLEGKTVAVGKPGSGTSAKAEVLLKEHGLIFDENMKAEFLGFSEGSDAMIDGIVDAVIISVGLPSGNVQELGASHKIRLLSFDEEKAKEIGEKYPYFSPEVIPAGTYDGIDKDVLTMGAPNEFGVLADMDEDFVYEICKILYDSHFEQFKNSHNSMKAVTSEILPKTSIPLHPGAEKFFKEKGWLE